MRLRTWGVLIALCTAFCAAPSAAFALPPVPPVSDAAQAAGLVDVRTVVPDAVIDLRYATPNNFVGVPMYPADARCLLHESMAPGLAAASLGAGFMLAVDTACRTAFATEMPPGIVTAFVRLHRVSANVQAHTGYGHVTVEEATGGSLDLATSYGRIEVGVAEGAATYLELNTSYGKVRNELVPSDKAPDEAMTVEVRARTSYGDITIRRR